MRLWHYKLIQVLPRKQLMSQWLELLITKRKWESGNINHSLVHYVQDADINALHHYARLVYDERVKRGIRTSAALLQEILQFNPRHEVLTAQPVYFEPHDDEYLAICYWNLREKYLRHLITEAEWQPLENFYKNIA